MNKLKALFVLLLAPVLTWAQEDGVEMADAMRENGKIYVVLTVSVIVFLVVLAYLIKVDLKVNKMYKELKDKE